jgi:DegV family protein with EDD domain
MPRTLRAIAVVTDSTAYLPDEALDRVGRKGGADRLTTVPLHVAISGDQRREGLDVSSSAIVGALNSRRAAVTTSRPAPAEFAAVYRQLLDQGATGVVSVHISARLSGTYEAAVLAAAEFGDRVLVVDSHATGMGLGFCVLAALAAAIDGQDILAVRDAATVAIGRTTMVFYVDTLEFLRRGGRIGAASALLGTALSVKPILSVGPSGVLVRERVRTAGRALSRLADLAVEAAGESTVDVAIHHLASATRAEELAATLVERLGGQLRRSYLTEIGAAVAVHVGPGMVCAVVHRLDVTRQPDVAHQPG